MTHFRPNTPAVCPWDYLIYFFINQEYTVGSRNREVQMTPSPHESRIPIHPCYEDLGVTSELVTAKARENSRRLAEIVIKEDGSNRYKPFKDIPLDPIPIG